MTLSLPRDRFITFFSVFLGVFPATVMSVEGAYGWIATGILALSIAGLIRMACTGRIEWSRTARLSAPLLIPYIAFFLAFLISVVATADSWRGIDYPNRWILLLPAVLFLVAARRQIDYSYFWAGIGIGSLLSGALALYQYLVLHLPQIKGFTAANPFGNVGITLAVLSALGALYARSPGRGIALLLAGWGGIAASILSTTRGGWPMILPFIVMSIIVIARLPKKAMICMVLLHVALLALAYPRMSEIIEKRTEQISSDLAIENARESSESSIGGRLAMWSISMDIWLEHPIVGVGPTRFKDVLHAKNAAEYQSDNIFTQNVAHQEWLDAMARAGILGGLAVTAVFLAPLVSIARRRRALRWRTAQGALGVTALIGAYVLFGLSNTTFTNHPALLFFIVCLSVLWSQYLRDSGRD